MSTLTISGTTVRFGASSCRPPAIMPGHIVSFGFPGLALDIQETRELEDCYRIFGMGPFFPGWQDLLRRVRL